MLKVGLTGGMGCGKSTVVDAMRELGAKIIDADQVARDVVKPGSEALQEIKSLFGDDILLESGALDRQKLKRIIFAPSDSGQKALAELEKITHPKIQAEIERQMNAAVSKFTDIPYLVIDIPLLFEKGYESMFDRIVVVDCEQKQQVERVKARDNMDEEIILKIIEQQATRAERQSIATDILDNSKDVEYLLNQVKHLHNQFAHLSLH